MPERQFEIVERIILCFDIRSSSNVIEDLTLTNHLGAMRDLLGGMKEYLRLFGERSVTKCTNSWAMGGFSFFLLISQGLIFYLSSRRSGLV